MNKPTTILLVEDEPLILMDLEFAAEDEGLFAQGYRYGNRSLSRGRGNRQIAAE